MNLLFTWVNNNVNQTVKYYYYVANLKLNLFLVLPPQYKPRVLISYTCLVEKKLKCLKCETLQYWIGIINNLNCKYRKCIHVSVLFFNKW